MPSSTRFIDKGDDAEAEQMMVNRRKWLVAAVVTATAVALVGTSATQASAATIWTLTDGFENNPEARWFTQGDGGHAFVERYTPHTGAYAASVTGYAPNGWGAVGRSLTPGVAGIGAGCTSAIYVRPLEPVTRIRFEVINPSTWTYIAYKDVSIGAPAEGYRPYQRVSGVNWGAAPVPIVFRIAAIAGSADSSAQLDDLTITCSSRTGPR